MLTHQQSTLLAFLEGYYERHGVMPSFGEMAAALDLRSKSNIHRLLGCLEERGHIRRLARRVRAIELVRPNEAPIQAIPLAGVTGRGRLDAASAQGEVVPPIGMTGPGEHLAVQVGDDSMRGAGILRGDLAVIRVQDSVPDGDIALVAVDGGSQVLRRCRQRGPALALLPDAPGHEIRIVSRARVRFIGRLTGIVRDYRNDQLTLASARR